VTIDTGAVEALLARAWQIPTLRKEDRKKAREIAALLSSLAKLLGPPASAARRLLVDAAAGHGYVAGAAAALLGARRLVVVERDPDRVARAEAALRRIANELEISIDVNSIASPAGDVSLWPAAPDVVVALHACGRAADEILDGAAAVGARHLFVVPCCYARAVAFSPRAEALAAALGAAHHAEPRRRIVEGLVDAERALRLEAAGYEVVVEPFAPPSLTPHNLAIRGRRVGEPRRIAAARRALERLHGTDDAGS
jgi:threonine dehydrogenase-like Zn-dependent dehydrogenase